MANDPNDVMGCHGVVWLLDIEWIAGKSFKGSLNYLGLGPTKQFRDLETQICFLSILSLTVITRDQPP